MKRAAFRRVALPIEQRMSICLLLSDGQLRAKMGDAGRAAVEQGYDWSDVATRTVRVYEDVLARRRAEAGNP